MVGRGSGIMSSAPQISDSRAGVKDTRMMESEWRPESLKIAQSIRAHAEAKGSTPGAFALAWLLTRPAISSLVVGGRNKEQFIQNFAAVDIVLSKEQLKPKGLWVLRKGHCFRNQTLNICSFSTSERHKNLALEGGSVDTLKRMIREVTGYTLIPELSFDAKYDSENVIKFSDPQPVREISIVTHKHFYKERLISELRKAILANTPDTFHKNAQFNKVKWR